MVRLLNCSFVKPGIILSGVDSLSIPGESAGEVFQKSVFTRLAHIGLEDKRMSLFAGKNWSVPLAPL